MQSPGTLARRGLYVLFKKNNTNMYLIIIGKIVLFIGFERGLLIKKYKKANSPRRDTVPGDCETIVGQTYK